MKKKSDFLLTGLMSLFATAFLGGCSKVVLFDPKGPVGNSERFVILVAIGLMLIVVVPVFAMAFLFSRKYRASNTRSAYTPNWDYSSKIDLVVWGVPFGIVTALAILSWTETHNLNPYKPIDSAVHPIRIEAVSLNWKWLFIYPDHNVAAVNQLIFPAKVPLSFRITSDTVMTSFFIPQLGSQIYAMAGRQTRLHLLADETGVFFGQNQQFSGRGFADMHFRALAVSREEFEAWVQKARQSPGKLDLARYAELEKPSVAYPVTYFSSVQPDLFQSIIRKYLPSGGSFGSKGKESASAPAKSGVLEGR
jgi:cytochrome o ubiquinol oxidase subunit 2